MLAFRRTFYIEALPFQEDNENAPVDLFRAVCARLGETLAAKLPDDKGRSLLAQWPNVPEGGATDQEGTDLTISASLWEYDRDVAPRLLEITLEQEPWRVELAVGQSEAGGPVIVYERAHWLGMGREIHLATYPDPLPAFEPFRVKNVEGYSPQVIRLRKEKVPDFIRFLRSLERQLPVIFYAGPDTAAKYGKPEAAEVCEKLQGLAYVVVAKDPQTVDRFNRELQSHPAYYGTIRLYRPCFQSTDSQWQHPYWPGRKSEPDTVFHQLLNEVARESLLLGPNEEIEDLRRKRLRQKLEQSRQAQDDAQTWEELAKKLEEDNAHLERQNKELRDENKKLRSRLHVLTVGRQDHAEFDQGETEPAPRLFFARTARAGYESLEPGERRYWSEHILPKLLQPELLRSQSESIADSKNGAVFVYPRGRSHDGRRAIYYLQDNDVYVCEIFTTNEHDRYGDLRAQGIDRADYDGFQEHRPDAPLLIRRLRPALAQRIARPHGTRLGVGMAGQGDVEEEGRPAHPHPWRRRAAMASWAKTWAQDSQWMGWYWV